MAHHDDTRALAAHWCVSLRTMQKWLARKPPLPVADDAAMVAWFISLPSKSQAKLTPAFRRKVTELRVARERRAPVPGEPGAGTSPHADPDYAAFMERATKSTDSGYLATLKQQRDFLSYKVTLSLQRNDAGALKDATDQLHLLSGIIHDEELRAQKLGREIGDIIPRAEAERIFRAIPYWLLRSADELLSVLSKRIADASGAPLFPEEVRQMVEPLLLNARVLHPFVRAAKINAGTALPRWAVEAMEAAHHATLDDPAGEYARLYAEPINSTTPPP